MPNLIILVPIYKATLDGLEALSLDVSLCAMPGRDIRFICSEKLEQNYYRERYPGIQFVTYPAICFASIQGYSRLLLSKVFYQQYAGWEFMLILQTDAVVLRDELDYWCTQPFDYVGAPWPGGHNFLVAVDRLIAQGGIQVHSRVGNGGFSLRRIFKCIQLLEEFPQAVEYFLHSGSSEDLFFGFMGLLSNDFVMPNEITASRFSMELQPSKYFAMNGGHLPMGGHAWWKYEPAFWLPHLPGAEELLP